MTDGCRQFPSSGQVFFCRQLHVLFISVAVVVAVTLACGGDSIRQYYTIIVYIYIYIYNYVYNIYTDRLRCSRANSASLQKDHRRIHSPSLKDKFIHR